jgi:hypothetical protein
LQRRGEQRGEVRVEVAKWRRRRIRMHESLKGSRVPAQVCRREPNP